MPRTSRFKIAQVEAALEASAGILAIAAQKLGCVPSTVRNYVDRHPRLQRRLAEIVEDNLDLAEAGLIKAMGEGNMTAIIFYLKTKGKQRGFIERGEVTGPGGGALQVTGPTIMLPPESVD